MDSFAAENGWMPTHHTKAQIDEFKAYVDSLVKIESNSKNAYVSLTRSLTERRAKEIRRWVENEQVLCSLDASYWEKNYSFVCDEKGQIFKFKNRKSQEVFDSVIADFDEKQTAIQIICLKGRQVGITTKVALKFIHRMLFIPHTQAVMASVQKDKSDLIERILDTAYTRCPWWLVPRRLPKKMFANGSILSIQSGMQPTGIAQGWTPQLIHISEVSLIPNPKNVIEEGLLPATHPSRNLFMVFEGTGAGNVGWFPDFWRDSKKNWPLGLARMCPVFIPWAMATDLYPQEDWLRGSPVPVNFFEKRLDATKKHVSRCETYIRNTPYLAKVAGANYRMPIEQQWYWEFEYRQAKERHTLQKFAARMPADDFEALTGVHDSVFDPEVVQEVEDHIYEVIGTQKIRKRTLQAYAITGHSIDEKFDPEESRIDDTKPAIALTWKSHRGERYDWNLIPIKEVNEDIESETLDLLLVYEPPVRGAMYSCGIDTAHGLGKEDEDRTCISICRNRSGSEFDSQPCELTSNRLNPAQTVPFSAAIATWYGEMMDDYRGVKFAIEQVEGPGDTCQNQLKIMGFNHHHKPGRYDGKKVRDVNKNREGWYSNRVSVPILMTRFIEAINGGWYKPSSKYLIEECKTLERHIVDGGKDKMVHRQGQHDDRVRAAAQAYFTVHDLDDLADRAQKKYASPVRKRSREGDGRAGLVSVGSWED